MPDAPLMPTINRRGLEEELEMLIGLLVVSLASHQPASSGLNFDSALTSLRCCLRLILPFSK